MPTNEKYPSVPVQLNTQPPDMQGREVDPRVGAYIQEGGQWARGFGDALTTLGKYATGKADQEPDLSQYILDMSDPSQLDEFSGMKGATQADLNDVQSAATAAIKLDRADQQNSSYRRSSAKRVALTRAYIAANPQYAPEFLKTFKLMTGEGVTKTIADMEKDQDAEAKKYREYVLDEGTKLGYNPTRNSFAEMQQAVAERDRLVASATVSAKNYQMLKDREGTTNYEMQQYFGRNVLPGYVAGAVSGLNELLVSYNPINPDLNLRNEILNNIASQKALLMSQMQQSGITDMQLISNMAGIFDVVNKQTTDYLDGTGTLQALQNSNNLLIKMAEGKLLAVKNVPMILALGSHMGESGIAPFMQEFAKLGNDIDFGRIISDAISAVSGIKTNPRDDAAKLGATTPEQQQQYFRDASNSIQALLSANTPETVQAANETITRYVDSVSGDQYDGRLFEQMLDVAGDARNTYTLQLPDSFHEAFRKYQRDMLATIKEDVAKVESNSTVTDTYFIDGVAVQNKIPNADLFEFTIDKASGRLYITAKDVKDPDMKRDNEAYAGQLNKKFSVRFGKLVNVIYARQGGDKVDIGRRLLEGGNPFQVQTAPQQVPTE